MVTQPSALPVVSARPRRTSWSACYSAQSSPSSLQVPGQLLRSLCNLRRPRPLPFHSKDTSRSRLLTDGLLSDLDQLTQRPSFASPCLSSSSSFSFDDFLYTVPFLPPRRQSPSSPRRLKNQRPDAAAAAGGLRRCGLSGHFEFAMSSSSLSAACRL